MIDIMKIKSNDFDTAMSKASNCFKDVYCENKKLREEVDRLTEMVNDEFANDKEIARLDEELRKCKETLAHSFKCSKEEFDEISKWEREHYHRINESRFFGATSSALTYMFIPTPVGTIGAVRCTCGEKFVFRDL